MFYFFVFLRTKGEKRTDARFATKETQGNMVKKFDFLVIGSGIAGMSYALKVAHKGKVALVCKTTLEDANTFFAQGGIASVTNELVDNFDKHIEDTMIAGDWISDRQAVEKVVREAPSQIQALIDWGVEFDKNEKG